MYHLVEYKCWYKLLKFKLLKFKMSRIFLFNVRYRLLKLTNIT